MKKIVLASASPRRRELLAQMGVGDFEVLTSACDETVPAHITSPGARVEYLAAQKAKAVFARRSDCTVIGADTVVVLDGAILGKPRDAAHAAAMLTALSGRTHEVYSGMAVLSGDRVLTAHERTEVTFRALSAQEIADYIATGEPLDKAGAYGIQGRACVFIRGICGDYYNVVGLPVCALHALLRSV